MESLKRFSTFIFAGLLVLLAMTDMAFASPIAIDPAPLTSAVDFATVATAITAIAALKFGPVVLRWVWGFLTSIFRSQGA